MALFRRDKQQTAMIPAEWRGVPAPAAAPAPPAPRATAPKPVPGAGQLPTARRAPGDGDPILAGLLDTAKTRDWGAVRAILSGYTGQDLSGLVANLCQNTPELDEWLPGVIGDGAGDPLARLVIGSRAVERGWSVRTTARAKNVSREQFKSFHEILGEAEQILYDAVELDRQSAAPWYYLLISGRGLEVGLPVLQRRFEALLSRCPGHVGAHRQMLQSHCRKWSGSHEQMHAFAQASLRGPYGVRLGELVAVAHIEHRGDLSGKDERTAYMHSDKVRAELIEAADRSINRPDFAAPARSPYSAYNSFAMAFSLAGLRSQACAAFEQTNGVMVEFPWSYWHNDELYAYNVWRDWSRKKV